MKRSSSTILTLLSGVALGFAAARLFKSKKVVETKDNLEERLHSVFMALHSKIMERHEKWLEEHSSVKHPQGDE